MNRLIILTAITLLIFSNQVLAERSIAIIGGGGEPRNLDKTIFDSTFNSMDEFLQENKWSSTISFDGGHSQSEALLSTKFPDVMRKSTFTANNFKAIIKNYENQIKTGKLKEGDQLMIMISSHGAINDTSELTHHISVGPSASKENLNDKQEATMVSLDVLKDLTKLAADNKIKLAILDFSCHSGNSIPLSNDTTCVISSSGTNHFGYTGTTAFPNNFVAKMKAGKTLEDVFLQARKVTTDQSFPMISTSTGRAINRDFYPMITPYLYYYEADPLSDKMNNYLLDAATINGQCVRQNQYANLLKQFDTLKAISALNMTNNIPNINRLISLVADYKSKQDQYINMLNSWGVPELERKETFVGIAQNGKTVIKMEHSFTWKEILEADFIQAIINLKASRAKYKKPADYLDYDASIEMHSKMLAKQQEILSRYPNLREYKNKFKEKLATMEGTEKIATQIATEERKLYDLMYTDLGPQTKEKNPCKDFVL